MSTLVPTNLASNNNDQEKLTQRQPPTPSRIPNILRNPWLKFSLRLGCTIILFAILFKSVSWSTMFQKLSSLDDGGLLIGVIVGVFGIVISSYQWQCLLDAEHIRIDLRRLVNLYLVGIAFNHFFPTGMGGDVVKAFYTGKEGRNNAGSISAVIMSRITGFGGMLLVSVPAILIWHRLFAPTFIFVFLLSCLALCGALGGALCCVSILPGLFQGKWREKRLVASAISLGQAIRATVGRPHSMAVAIMFGVLFHMSAALNYYSYALVLHITTVPFTFYLVAIPFVSLIAFLPISINGFGLRETTLVGLFLMVHVPTSTALIVALLMDVQTLLFGLIGGCIYLAMSRKKQSDTLSAALIQSQELSAYE